MLVCQWKGKGLGESVGQVGFPIIKSRIKDYELQNSIKFFFQWCDRQSLVTGCEYEHANILPKSL